MTAAGETLSFSVANILGDRDSASENLLQRNRYLTLKTPAHNAASSKYLSRLSSDVNTIIKENSCKDINSRPDVRHHGRSPHSPPNSHSSAATSPLSLRKLSSSEESGEIVQKECISPAANTHELDITEDVELVDGGIESSQSSRKEQVNPPKNGRMRFSTEQVQILERRFQEQHYLLPADRKILSLALKLSERQVKTWFQNKRAQYKRTRPLVRSPIYHTVSPTFISRSMQQLLTTPGSPSFHPSHAAVGISLRDLTSLMCTSPSSLSPIRSVSVTMPTFPRSPCTVTPTFFQMPTTTPTTLNFVYPTNALQGPLTLMAAPK